MQPRWPLQAVGDVLACIGFFTRLPIFGSPERRLGDTIWAAPVVGLLVGLCGAAAFGLSSVVGLPEMICAILAIASTVLVTGCLHEDGLADVADGFGGGMTRERKLDIMRDSRIGTYGVVALVLTIAARVSAVSEIGGENGTAGGVLLALVAAHAASRASFAAFMLVTPSARSAGLAASGGSVSAGTALIAMLIGLSSLLVLLGPLAMMVGTIALAAWFALLRAIAMRQIGGHTGDVLGTLQQGGEIIVLFVGLILVF